MKLLAFGLMATLVAVAFPVNAQVGNVGSTDKVERISGSRCISELTEKGKESTKAGCHHVVLITGSDSLTFRFDSEKEDDGIFYVVSKKMERDSSGRTYFPMKGLAVRSGGKESNLIAANGICSTDNTELKMLAAACVAELNDGTKVNSMLIK